MRIVIAEDSVLLQEGLARILADAGHEIVATVDNADALVHEARRHQPDLCIIDVRMPPTFTDEGVRAAVTLRSGEPPTAVLVLSQWVEEHYATELLAANTGHVGYLLKDRVADVADFLEAVTRVAEGGTAFDAEVVAQLLARRRADSPLDTLTPRELDVLSLIGEGRSNQAIAQQLYVSTGTVEKHVTNIFTKLDLADDQADHRRVLAALRFLGR